MNRSEASPNSLRKTPKARSIVQPSTNSFERWHRLFGEVRTLLWYIVLMVFFMAASLPLIRQFIFVQVDARVREDIFEDIEGFRNLLANDPKTREQLGLHRGQGSRDFVKPPSNRQELKNFFEAYLSRRIPEDDTFLIALVNGQLYKSSPRGLPKGLRPDSELVQYWLSLQQSAQGEKEIPGSKSGSVLYIAAPIWINGEVQGIGSGKYVVIS